MISSFRVMVQFWENAPNDSKIVSTCSTSKVPISYHTPETQIFGRFVLCWAIFQLCPNFRKCTEWPQNNLDMGMVQSVDMHATHTPEVQIFVHFTLPWAILCCGPILRKMPQMTSKCPWQVQGQKYQYPCYTIPLRSKFSSISLYDELFSSKWLVLRKVHWMTPKCPWYVQGQKYPYVYHIHAWGPIFVSFSPQWSLFKLQSNFDKNAPNDSQIILKGSR